MVRLPYGYHRRAGGWPPGLIVPAGSMVRRRLLPPSISPRQYVNPAVVPIGPYGFASGIVTGAGACQLFVGPTGYRATWELAQASVTTTTGAADTSTVSFFAQPAGTPSGFWQVGQSYAGGGDQVGLAGIKLVTGEYLYAIWTGAKPGDTASLVLSGRMTVLT